MRSFWTKGLVVMTLAALTGSAWAQIRPNLISPLTLFKQAVALQDKIDAASDQIDADIVTAEDAIARLVQEFENGGDTDILKSQLEDVAQFVGGVDEAVRDTQEAIRQAGRMLSRAQAGAELTGDKRLLMEIQQAFDRLSGQKRRVETEAAQVDEVQAQIADLDAKFSA
jgi:predicted  nucleic acid-binding Zn-ribbon protein